MINASTDSSDYTLSCLRSFAAESRPINASLALSVLEDQNLDIQELIEIAAIPRRRHFGKRMQIHIINNLRNGHCPEDCSYCAQGSNSKANSIFNYTDKSEEEVLAEARLAWESGAYRYCLVSAGRGPNKKSLQYYASLIQKIKKSYPLEVCLSAGLLKNAEDASILANAGLDRYNHNLNTSREYYPRICSSHTYQDRIDTLTLLQNSGIALCSGLIAGMGESSDDLVRVAMELQTHKVASLPVNFFLPVSGHALKKLPESKKLQKSQEIKKTKESRESQSSETSLDTEDCLRILCMLRLTNPRAEIRMAAGRELYLKERQKEAFAVANSLFVSGYLNVQGSSAAQTIALIEAAGYEVESNGPQNLLKVKGQGEEHTSTIRMKSKKELRPFEYATKK